jgi:hypothetical protein
MRCSGREAPRGRPARTRISGASLASIWAGVDGIGFTGADINPDPSRTEQENMVKHVPPGKDHSRSGAPDVDTIAQLQEKYCKARLASGDLPPEIVAKIKQMQELSSKLHGGTEPPEKADVKEIKRLSKLASEVALHTNFKVDDVNWYEPDVERLLTRGVKPKRR